MAKLTRPTDALASFWPRKVPIPRAFPAFVWVPDRPGRHNVGCMGLARATWAITAAVFAVLFVILLAEAYYGYAIVTAVIAIAAGVNLL
jgi:hypothetical protein